MEIGIHQGSVLLSLLFSVEVDVFTENARKGLMNKILYADNLVSMSEGMENLRKKFLKWKETFKSKGLKINLKKTKGKLRVQKKKYSRV